MTLRHLKIFVAVCEYGSTTKAAEALFIVQPTISHTIAEMEHYYNVKLFDRINQRLVVTDTGKELLVKAKEILGGFDDFESLATCVGQNPKVRIGASLTLGQMTVPKFLQRIKDEGICVRPQILIRQAGAIERELERGNLDFAIVGGEIESPYLKSEAISLDRFVAVCNAHDDIPEKLTVEQLTTYPLLLREYGSASRDYFEKVAAGKGLKIEPLMDSSNNQALVTALYASLGVAFLPDSYVKDHLRRGRFKEITIEGLTVERGNYLVIHKNKRLNDLQQQAYDLLKEIK